MNAGWKKNPVGRWNLSKVATAATTAVISFCRWDAMAFTGLPVAMKPSFKISGVHQVYDSALFALVQGDDSVLRKSQIRYVGKVNFCRWNVNDKENTRELKKFFIAEGYTLKKLPSLVLFRGGKPIAVRPGFANEFQLDDWLETTLPDHLERTFDENGVKMIPLPTAVSQVIKNNDVVQKLKTNEELHKKHLTDGDVKENEDLMNIILETEIWHNRTVVPAMDGILLPTRP